MLNSEFESLRDLGKRFGVSSHVIGRWLAQLGLRAVGRSPTAKAFKEGLVKTVPTGRGDGGGYFYIWHVARTTALLEAAGHKQVQYEE